MKKIIKFGSTWCAPCKVVDKILKEIIDETDIEVEFIDVDENDELVDKYNIRNIPTLLYFVDGQQVNKSVGSISREELLNKF